MKTQQIKQLALSIVEQGEVSSDISQWIFKIAFISLHSRKHPAEIVQVI